MSIHKIGSDLVRPLAPRAVGGEERSKARQGDSGDARSARSDEVQISAEGRELAAQASASEPSLSQARIDEIQERISLGHYDEPAVAETVARRMLEGGDL